MAFVDSPQTAYDFAGYGALRAKAAKDPSNDEAISKAAKQFEAMFLQMMLKSMRDATPKGGLLDSKAMDTYEQMFDQQLVMGMTERGSVGIAEMVEQFIRKTQGGAASSDVEKFLLDSGRQDGLPLVNESDTFSLPEGSTQEFLLNRDRFLLDGGDR
jgi:flagellar protein FlgJ